jgi:hypothetical protein
LVVRLIHGSATVIVTIILLGSNALPQSESERVGISANELARKVITNELKFQYDDHGHWMYRLEKEESGRKQVQEIVETKNGSLSRFLSIDGHSLDSKQRQKENQRLQRLVAIQMSNGNCSRRATRRQNKGRACSIFCPILPDAFVFSYAGRQGDLVTLTFRPNPDFKPASIETQVFHAMQSEMTVDTEQERLAAINGLLMEDVKFGGGLLGHLDKGGKFEVRQAEVAPGQWEMTVLGVDMKGKALLFKTVGMQETETTATSIGARWPDTCGGEGHTQQTDRCSG